MAASAFTVLFSEVEDPRIERSKRHELVDILFICVAATTGVPVTRQKFA